MACNALAPSALFPFFGEGSPTKIDYRRKGTLILTSLLEDLVEHLSIATAHMKPPPHVVWPPEAL